LLGHVLRIATLLAVAETCGRARGKVRRPYANGTHHVAPPASTVANSLPVLFFGDLFTATAVTVAINPSFREYLDHSGHELDEACRRFETLTSLGAADRPSLTDEQCQRAVGIMRRYFEPGRPVYDDWFGALRFVLRGLGLRYETGDVAHLDLVQEATRLTWSDLEDAEPEEAAALLRDDEGFLRWQLETFPIRLVVCNGRRALDAVRALLGVAVQRSGRFERVTWTVGSCVTGSRAVRVAGWNLALARAGLLLHEQIQMGQQLAAALDEATPI
jgi:hypothetical protein